MEPKKIVLNEIDGELVATPEDGPAEVVTSSEELFDLAPPGELVEMEIDGDTALTLTEQLVLPPEERP